MPEQALRSGTVRFFSSCACKSPSPSMRESPIAHRDGTFSLEISDEESEYPSIYCAKPQSERLTWSLTPHSPAGAFAHKDSASPLLTLSEEKFGRQDLLLRRAMLAGLLPVYVDRFARAWHRLATTDALGLLASII